MSIRKIVFVIIAAVAGLSILPSCHIGCVKGSGNKVSESRKVGNFNKIEISGGYKISLKQDSSQTLTITADDNLMKYIRTEVSGDKLRIHTRKNLCNSSPIIISLGVKNLQEIKGSGTVELTAEGRLNVTNLDIRFSGASKIDMDLSAAALSTHASGATEISLTGQAASHSVEVSGVCKLHAFDFVVGSYKINTSGSADCQINVLKSLNVNTSGAADIEYKGNPTNVETDKSGAASVKKVE